MFVRILVITLTLMSFGVSAHAELRKGNVPGNGTRRFAYTPNADGGSQITLIFDNPNSDLDIIVGTVVNGDTLLVCQGISTLRQFERCEFGAEDSATYTILIDSFRGGSPFRLYVGTMSDETLRVATSGVRSEKLVEEDYLDRASLKMLEEAKKLQQLKK
jgi:hypothetical protein